MNDPERISQQLSDWLDCVDAATIPRDRKHDMVVFLDRVVEVVEQAFREILRVCIELKYLPQDVSPSRISSVQKELDSLSARDRYRDVEFICGRLHLLREQFERDHFRDLLKDVGADFRFVFCLIDERESALIDITQKFLRQTEGSLKELAKAVRDGDPSIALADTIARDAEEKRAELTRVVAELGALHARILGSVDTGGLLDMFLQRDVGPKIQVDARQLHVRGDYVGGSQTKAGRDINQPGRDIARGPTKEPASIDDARVMLLAELNKLPADRRTVVGKQVDALIDDIQRRSDPSAIQEKAAALEKMLESGKILLGSPARIAWNFLKMAAGLKTQ